MEVRKLIEEGLVENVLGLPKRYDDAFIGIDCIYYDRVGYDICKIEEKNRLLWSIDYWLLKLRSRIRKMPMPYFVDTKSDPTGLKCYDNLDEWIIGVVDNQRLAYTYDGLIRGFMLKEGWEYEEAAEWVDYNTLRATPYEGSTAPIVFQTFEEY